MVERYKNVGVFNKCNYEWTVSEWSKIPLNTISESLFFNLKNNECNVQSLGIFVLVGKKVTESDKEDSTEKIKVSLSIIKPDNLEVRTPNGRVYYGTTTLKKVQTYVTGDKLTFSIGVSLEG
ncbi:hypothetical protein J3Q64DRAFT_1699032 [Phycomyces blakesleeanus]|uniref:Uncharacterized protein n=2 Tax=Phycomyces blakesleeanus TaxID=4837 RepID=A0A162U8U2_PHYB8|nr:hypothetical protein PHYBLDRAFT_168658 [Phycomyces blakesleeanus NRRL 1555(-)]OAD73303.1 hypothetical protein PHYBLDRAFT_168658 [Phycomyces blakesleeanus NRRL 1555(-)]|eukprot:XP_018291343.1 hypothetical protein PHYBLDRAFT_168658 [Phycomyces blakesleeanus NRRL 1555(-)]